MYVKEDGTVIHKSYYLVWFWCIFAAISVIAVLVVANLITDASSLSFIPLPQIVTFAGTTTTLYIGADKAVKAVKINKGD